MKPYYCYHTTRSESSSEDGSPDPSGDSVTKKLLALADEGDVPRPGQWLAEQYKKQGEERRRLREEKGLNEEEDEEPTEAEIIRQEKLPVIDRFAKVQVFLYTFIHRSFLSVGICPSTKIPCVTGPQSPTPRYRHSTRTG